MLRRPIVTIVGHVDHGKTTLLDTIRETTVANREAGAITQAIGASIVPIQTIKKLCGKLLDTLKTDIKLPGLLFIDTPGHAAFSNLRKRGGNLADIAVLIVDVNEGFKPQTIEAVEILKQYKTPFVVAANKVDLVSGWQKKTGNIIESVNQQNPQTIQFLDTKLYELVGTFHEQGFEAERFDRVKDITKQISMVPVCAKSGEGIAELLMLITGLAQRFLEEKLHLDAKKPAKGTILEVKEEQGLGTTLDVIIYEGSIKINDTIIIGGVEEPIVSKVRALVKPKPLAEIRDKKSRFTPVKEIIAATGVKIAAPNIDGAIAGMPLWVAPNAQVVETSKASVQKEVDEVLIETDTKGIIVKADSLGSLEALITLLKDKNIDIRKASVGNITKKDFIDAQSNYEDDPLIAVILGFNVVPNLEVESMLSGEKAVVLTNKVIYRLIEDFESWAKKKSEALQAMQLEGLVRPCKLEFMPNCTFRQSNPAVIGVDVVAGVVVNGINLIKSDGKTVGMVKSMQIRSDPVSRAETGAQIALSIDGVTVGRQVKEGDTLYSAIPENDFRQLKKHSKFLSKQEITLLKEIASLMREKNPVWGV
ncbi:translation initiation factor IF-2 [Candidatus Woesearchaeota archaeon]|nr:translation initiation factor IF-2 [Candidatus Woesearchaeota archaeon]